MANAPDFAAILAGLTVSMSQADIARRLHIDPSTVCRLLDGSIRQPSYQTGTRIMALSANSAKSLKSLVPLSKTFGVMD